MNDDYEAKCSAALADVLSKLGEGLECVWMNAVDAAAAAVAQTGRHITVHAYDGVEGCFVIRPVSEAEFRLSEALQLGSDADAPQGYVSPLEPKQD